VRAVFYSGGGMEQKKVSTKDHQKQQEKESAHKTTVVRDTEKHAVSNKDCNDKRKE
jgi:hypothetical protein